MNITATELRIGNYLQVGKYIWKVDTIIADKGQLQELYFEENPEYDHALNAEPTPLTPELLGQCGFEFIRYGGGPNSLVYGLDYIEIMPNAGCWLYLIGRKEDGSKRFVKFQYLHQLQNLYWCLCGEELEIKLPQII